MIVNHSEHMKIHYPKSLKWSKKYDSCIICKETKRHHGGYGMCWHCYRQHKHLL